MIGQPNKRSLLVMVSGDINANVENGCFWGVDPFSTFASSQSRCYGQFTLCGSDCDKTLSRVNPF